VLVFRTGRPARIDDYSDASEQAIDIARKAAVRSAVGVPLTVGAGCGIVGVTSGSRVPAGAEEKLAGFTEVLGTAIINAQAQAELAASRARIVAVGDTARRRIKRNLHDSAQQRPVTLGLQLRGAGGAAAGSPRTGPSGWKARCPG
jgi:hypothetical protein